MGWLGSPILGGYAMASWDPVCHRMTHRTDQDDTPVDRTDESDVLHPRKDQSDVQASRVDDCKT